MRGRSFSRYVLLRESYANVVAKAGVSIPAGTSQYKVMGAACANRTRWCESRKFGMATERK